MKFVRNVIFPTVWNYLRAQGKTREDITTREIKIYAEGVAGIVLDILADMHMGGVHKCVNSALSGSQKRAQEIIWDTQRICLDLWDRLTLGSVKERPTNLSDLSNLWDYFSPLARITEGGHIWWIDGNHDRRMLEKIAQNELDRLNWGTKEIGFKQITHPVDLANGRIRLHGMPCYNTQKGLYTPESVRELIWNINNGDGVNIVMVHNPDGVRQIEAIKQQLQLRIDRPTLFLCGHTHGLLGFSDVPWVGAKLAQWARKWINMEPDTPYTTGYYPAQSGEPYGIFVSRGMGDQADIFRILWGGRERPILRFVERESMADIVIWGR
jgi:predicted MPP superfamily phosphohydrolase